MATKWRTVVELPGWTPELALAALDAGIELIAENGFTAETTTVAMVVEAELPDLARRYVRDMLASCNVRVGIAPAFRGPVPASDEPRPANRP